MAVIAHRGVGGRAARTRDDDVVEREVVTTGGVATGQLVVARIIRLITGLLLILLAFRFVFALLAANPNNGFANFIYTTSHPFVAPFFGLFNYNYLYGVHRFEAYTIVAFIVYAVIGWALAYLVTLNRRY